MSNIKQFFDKDGNDIFPVTHASAVFDDAGKSIETNLIETNDVISYTSLSSNCIYVDSIPGIIKFDKEDEAVANIDACKNAELLQPYISANCRIKFNAGYYPFENELHIFTGTEIFSDSACATLLFPDSRGLVTSKKEYCANLKIHDIKIYSKNNTIDLKNDGTNYPYNVYFAQFYNMQVRSDEGHCFYAGNNRGSGGDQLAFNIKFDNVKVNAPNGSGICGFGGLMTFYENISDWGKIKYVFYNCNGVWRDCNTTFAAAEYFLYCDDTCGENYGAALELYNVNMESVLKGGILVNTNRIGHGNVIFENSSVAIRPSHDDEGNIIPLTNHPLHLGLYTGYIRVVNSRIGFEGGATWGQVYPDFQESFLSLDSLANIKQIESVNIKMYSRSVKKVVTFNPIDNMLFSPAVNDWYTQCYPVTPESHSKNFVGGRIQQLYTLDIKEGASAYINLGSVKETYDGIEVTSSEVATPKIEGVMLRNTITCRPFMIVNKLDIPLTLNRIDGWATKFKFKNDVNTKVLQPGEVACFLYKSSKTTGGYAEIEELGYTDSIFEDTNLPDVTINLEGGNE